MGTSLRGLALFAVAVAGALPAIDGSFLTRGIVPSAAPPSIKAPLFLATPPGNIQMNGSETATGGAQKTLCPMVTLEPDSNLDPAFTRDRPTATQFEIRVQKPACKSR